ncbi:MAG: nucleotide exchange factor GrpE [Candidatus Altiarchaeales archaeon]|nr:MAG: nucleotide exchange factor GrpE [Candidatus Altiarchaeales archaeon]HDI72788.1 nucleotide exchange factor GrpE [Candidatus Altiarchaeales archaeon]
MHSKHRKRGKSKKELEKEVEGLKKEIEELRKHSLRQRADFENYRKQLDREREEFMKYANEKLITQLLEVIDNFERALPELEKNDPESARGIEMIYKQLMQILEKAGLRRIEAIGKKFDPYYHEAFLREKSDEPEGTILEELQKGYMLNLKVIRHSKVKVSKGK